MTLLTLPLLRLAEHATMFGKGAVVRPAMLCTVQPYLTGTGPVDAIGRRGRRYAS